MIPAMCSIFDWDINDAEMQQVTHHDRFHDWVDGHMKMVYSPISEDAKRHSSGWAMRNTNNHNVVILKKSCLGVIVCSKNCSNEFGEKTHLRPAICDKARKKQQGRSCTNPFCEGKLVIMPCRGHCGYPVTHFWRHTPQGIFFQSKGVHDHPRPEVKSSSEVSRKFERVSSKQKSSSYVHVSKKNWSLARRKRSPPHHRLDDLITNQVPGVPTTLHSETCSLGSKLQYHAFNRNLPGDTFVTAGPQLQPSSATMAVDNASCLSSCQYSTFTSNDVTFPDGVQSQNWGTVQHTEHEAVCGDVITSDFFPWNGSETSSATTATNGQESVPVATYSDHQYNRFCSPHSEAYQFSASPPTKVDYSYGPPFPLNCVSWDSHNRTTAVVVREKVREVRQYEHILSTNFFETDYKSAHQNSGANDFPVDVFAASAVHHDHSRRTTEPANACLVTCTCYNDAYSTEM